MPPVGSPLHNREVQIVDNDGNPVADGEIGEMVISSRYIALGYWEGARLQVRPSGALNEEIRCRR